VPTKNLCGLGVCQISAGISVERHAWPHTRVCALCGGVYRPFLPWAGELLSGCWCGGLLTMHYIHIMRILQEFVKERTCDTGDPSWWCFGDAVSNEVGNMIQIALPNMQPCLGIPTLPEWSRFSRSDPCLHCLGKIIHFRLYWGPGVYTGDKMSEDCLPREKCVFS
jgi:hypothetical protein